MTAPAFIFYTLSRLAVIGGMVSIFQVRGLRGLARTHPRSPGDSEAENLGLVMVVQALVREVTAAICCCLAWAAVSWVRARVHRPLPVQRLEEKSNLPESVSFSSPREAEYSSHLTC